MSSTPPQLGYCTNVHPGVDVASIVANLESVSAKVRQSLAKLPGESEAAQRRRDWSPPLPVGLWISAAACAELRRDGTAPLIACLKKNRLTAYTLNGFPYDNFHQKVVKRSVYQPAWWQDERLLYTRDLAKILSELLPAEATTGSISTLPIGWPQHLDSRNEDVADEFKPDQLHHAGTNLRRLAEDLRRLEERSGKRIVVGLEPEPGCILSHTNEVVDWFDQQLPDATHRRYIGVCHDVCHSAVMGENQSEVLQKYASESILLTKIQLSSAVVADWQSIPKEDHREAIDQMAEFAEDRYLHQTGRVDSKGKFSLAEDLPELIADHARGGPANITDRRWVTHFHVPLFSERFGHLTTTQSDVSEAIAKIDQLTAMDESRRGKAKPLQFTGHYEIETYAWTVLPESMRSGDLVDDIAGEFLWLRQKHPTLAPIPPAIHPAPRQTNASP